MQFIDVQAQYRAYQQAIDDRIQRVMDHGRFIMGPEVAEIEQVLADFVGVRHCITTASGTDSIEIALRALQIGPGDEVITVPFTFISTAEAVAQVGATPVFVDIEADTFNMDATQLEACITERTKAIMPVSLFGQMPDFSVIQSIAQKHGLPVIEDAAQSFGASQGPQKSCAVSTIASTSFFPAKPFGCFGDGGALFTSDDTLADTMRAIRNHGSLERHEHTVVGMNGRFDSLQAAVLLAKFPHFEDELRIRSEIGAYYSERLGNHYQTPVTRDGNSHVFAQYTLRVANRTAFAASLKESGIPTAVYYPHCLHHQPVFKPLGYAMDAFPVAEKAAREVISIPMHPFLSQSDKESIVAASLAALPKN